MIRVDSVFSDEKLNYFRLCLGKVDCQILQTKIPGFHLIAYLNLVRHLDKPLNRHTKILINLKKNSCDFLQGVQHPSRVQITGFTDRFTVIFWLIYWHYILIFEFNKLQEKDIIQNLFSVQIYWHFTDNSPKRPFSLTIYWYSSKRPPELAQAYPKIPIITVIQHLQLFSKFYQKSIFHSMQKCHL